MLRALVLWPVGDFKPNVLWTLRLELIFYLVIALCLLGRQKRIVLLTLWCLLPILVRAVGIVFPSLLADGSEDNFTWVMLMGHQAGANLQFGIGILVGLCWVKVAAFRNISIGGGVLSLVVYAALASCLLELLGDADPRGFTYIVPSSLLAGGGLILALCVKRSGSFIGRIGNILGNASYSIYLTHFIPLFVMLEIARRVTLPGSQALHLVVFVVIAIFFGCCVHYVVERPLIAWTRKLMETRTKLPEKKPA